MGVIYKLKKEVVDFILANKKDDPSLSCRALSSLLEKEFGQTVSKSSINKILKEADLSSPVGRRGSENSKPLSKPKKFKLSEHKKKIIFPEATKSPILSDMAQVKTEDGFVDGVGGIFLRAAEWEIAREPVLESLLKEYCHQDNDDKLRVVATILPLLKIFHIESLEGLANYQGRGLWALNDSKDSLNEGDVARILEQISDRQEFFLKFSMKLPQLFAQILGFRFTLKDGASFFIDGQGVSVWKNIQHGFSISLAKATENLAKVLNNVQSVIINAVSAKDSGKIQESYQIADFFHSFENVQSKRIKKIELIGEDEEVLGDFDGVPQIKRRFVAGIWPWESLFQKFLEAKNFSSQGKVEVGIDGRELFYREAGINRPLGGRGLALRGILLHEPFMQVPFLILATNAPTTEMSAEDCVRAYAQRWPNIEKGVNFALISDPAKWKSLASIQQDRMFRLSTRIDRAGRDPVWFAIEQLILLLDRFSRRNYFFDSYEQVDFSSMIHRFYSLPGRISRNGSNVVVYLQAPPSSTCQTDLSFAAQRFNESNIRNFANEHINIYIK